MVTIEPNRRVYASQVNLRQGCDGCDGKETSVMGEVNEREERDVEKKKYGKRGYIFFFFTLFFLHSSLRTSSSPLADSICKNRSSIAPEAGAP